MARIEEIIQRNKNKLIKRGPGGQLSQESPEEIQSLAGKAGLQAPPLTALGGQMLGATPQQTKMMGTPAQKQAALDLSQAPLEESLAAAQRRAQPRAQATAEEQATMEKSEALKALGGTGERVGKFIERQRQQLMQASQPVQVEAAQTYAGQDITALKPVLDQLRSDPTNAQLQLQVNQALGRGPNNILSPEEINRLYEGAVDSIARGVAGNIDDDLTLSDLMEQEGFEYTPEQLAELLGVPQEQLGGMSLGQLKDTVGKLLSDEFSKTEETERLAGSGQIGVAERGLARQAARELSRTGMRATEADIANLDQQIANADEVQFGGEYYRVDDLLKDENISNLITSYLTSGPDSDLRRRIDSTEPELKEFIIRNQALLEDASQALQVGAQQFSQLQETRRQQASLDGMLSQDVASKLVPSAFELGAEGIDPSTIPALAVTSGMNANQKQAYANNINTLEGQYPGIADQLSSLTEDEIRALQLDSPKGKWRNFTAQMDRYQEISQAGDNELVGLLFDVGDRVDFGEQLRANTAMSTLGFAKPSKSLSILDSDGDGQIDSPDQIRQRLASTAPSLKDIAAGKSTVAPVQKYTAPPASPVSFLSPEDKFDAIRAGDKHEIQASLFKRLRDAAADGIIDTAEVKLMGPESKLSADSIKNRIIEMDYLNKNGTGLTPGAQKTLSNILDKSRETLSSKYLDDPVIEDSDKKWKIDSLPKLPVSDGLEMRKDINLAINKVKQAMKEDQFYNKDMLKSRLDNLEGKLLELNLNLIGKYKAGGNGLRKYMDDLDMREALKEYETRSAPAKEIEKLQQQLAGIDSQKLTSDEKTKRKKALQELITTKQKELKQYNKEIQEKRKSL